MSAGHGRSCGCHLASTAAFCALAMRNFNKVDLCLTGPRSVADLTAALDALEKVR